MADIEIIEAVAGQPNRASVYNKNFQSMKEYIQNSVDEINDNVSTTLTNYVNVNGLGNSGLIKLEPNKVYNITPVDEVKFSLPDITDNTKYYQILVRMNLDTLYDIDLGTDWGFNSVLPAITQAGKYNIIYEYDGSNWVCGIMTRNEVA